jgi:ATP-binding cassette subfamily B protein
LSNETSLKDKTGDFLDLKLLSRIIGLAKPYKLQFGLAIALTILLAVLLPLQPIIIQKTLDTYVANGDVPGLNKMLYLLLALLFVQTLLLFFNTYLTNWLGQSVIKDMRLKVFDHISRLKVRFYDKTAVGTLVTRCVSDIETIADVFAQGIITIAGDLLQLTVITVFMLYTDWRLSLIVFSVLPVLIYASNIFRKGVKTAFQSVRTQVAALNAFVQEHITGMSIVQIFNKEEEELEKFKSINQLHLDANKKSIFHYAIFFPIVEIITATAVGLLVWYASRNALDGKVTAGVMVSFILYINMFFRPIRLIADRFNTLQMGMVAGERIFKLVDNQELIEVDGNHQSIIEGKVSFKNVSFSYETDKPVLKDISFLIEPGKTLAIVGSTGSGKSTIASLITRLYDYQTGEICIDDIEIKEWELDSMRSQIAFVLQDVFLFSGSIQDNITLLNEGITKEAMREATESIGAEGFIESLEGAYQYNVQERGNSLSVGQRQLISFIRALAFNPKILILDEATSSVDSETEALIQKAVDRLMNGRTALVIAHRLSTIRNADKIVVLEHGEIVESGSHEDLIQLNGRYAEMLNEHVLDVIEDE